ncbi:CubicO group peptidase (beta-lactamase class C family) [Actinoplanes lutulentus]|uniref:CubicO group peptidase (Beta-lactamase class C family) n=1 Tax=Actinoplanes lutulentus TaxID=1287878 RepID=A0A327ZBF9_9ACTN|nr:serine hydrolase domain-containing protein [Actinoplanes lutulentus]MBB2941411.1 CubicO group peptidase (beta-lactamase class C family) [Actinoplanes lutulentus]RAK36902.1 CubicO group peptidase (beta-lactamase class C family) [Actinoplanes lutulentus]
MLSVRGFTDDAFAPVADALAALPEDPGSQLVVWSGGRVVADLWTAGAGGADALTGVYSAGKGAAYLVVARLVADGVLDLDRRVVEYWPEFTLGQLTLGDLLAHRAGLIGVDGGFTPDELRDDRAMAGRLLRQEPYWRPGSAYGYHAFTIGALLGEVVRHATGRTLVALFNDLIRTDVFFGTSSVDRYRPVLAPPQRIRVPAGSLTEIAFNLHASPPTDMVSWINLPEVRAGGPVSGGCVASARGLARMYAAAVWGVDGGRPLVDRHTLTEFATISSDGFDRVTGERRHFGLGFEVQHLRYPGLSVNAFGHSGASGAHALADPGRGIVFAYTRQRCAYPTGAAPEVPALLATVLAGG